MLISFVNVPSHPVHVMTAYPPGGVLSIAACLKASGHEVQFLDADVCRLTPDVAANRLRSDSPRLIGLSLNVGQVSHAGSYINKIREILPSTPIVVGGPYVTGVRERIFKDFPDIDFAVVHEGEYASQDLVAHLEGRMSLDAVRNLIYRDAGRIMHNRCERIENLDALPLPDYSLVSEQFHMYHGAYPSIASPSVAIVCTRGCPYNCTFCSSPTSWGRKLTFRSTDSVIGEILLLIDKFSVREIFFQDDTMNARPEWFFELCDKIIAYKLHRRVFFKCPFRVNSRLLSEEVLKRAREANFWMIFYGVENGDQNMLNAMQKGITIAEIERAFAMTREAGLASYASLMVGNIGETRETAMRSIELMKAIMPDYGGFAIAAPFPGSRLYSIAKEKGYITNEDFTQYQFGECILRTEALNADEITALADDANRQFARLNNSSRYLDRSSNCPFVHVDRSGLYPREEWCGGVNRTAKKVNIFLPPGCDESAVHLRVLPDYPDIAQSPVTMTIRINGSENTIVFDKSEWREISIPLPDGLEINMVRIQWEVDRTWNPSETGININDNRDLGVTLKEVWLDRQGQS